MERGTEAICAWLNREIGSHVFVRKQMYVHKSGWRFSGLLAASLSLLLLMKEARGREVFGQSPEEQALREPTFIIDRERVCGLLTPLNQETEVPRSVSSVSASSLRCWPLLGTFRGSVSVPLPGCLWRERVFEMCRWGICCSYLRRKDQTD